jgi:hypothetical protein
MSKNPRIRKLTKRIIDATRPGKLRYVIWDEELKGFGIRIEKTGVISFIVRYRPGGGRRAPLGQMALGRFGVLTVDQARLKAKGILGQVAEGDDPVRNRTKARDEMTVAELCDLYFSEGSGKKKLQPLSPIMAASFAISIRC